MAEIRDTTYEPPALVVIGSVAELTLVNDPCSVEANCDDIDGIGG